MTTIVYSNDIIAADSRCTAGGVIMSDNDNKIINARGVTFILSGATSGVQEIIKAYFGEPYDKNLGVGAIIIDKGSVYIASLDDEDDFWKDDITGQQYCMGSGAPFAWTALDLGCDAVMAVKMAMKRDIYSGGKVRTYKVKKA